MSSRIVKNNSPKTEPSLTSKNPTLKLSTPMKTTPRKKGIFRAPELITSTCYEKDCENGAYYKCSTCNLKMCVYHTRTCTVCTSTFHYGEDDIEDCFTLCNICGEKFCNNCFPHEGEDLLCYLCIESTGMTTCRSCSVSSNKSGNICPRCKEFVCKKHKFKCCSEPRATKSEDICNMHQEYVCEKH